MRSGDFVLFAAYALVGLVLPLSSFFLTLLEYYRLRLQHLSPNSIALVAIFVHLCEMFVGVRPSVRLFRRFFVLKVASQSPQLLDGYYFQRRTLVHARYISPIYPEERVPPCISFKSKTKGKTGTQAHVSCGSRLLA
jgi:hypothetical protein